MLAVDDDPLMLDAYRRQFTGNDYQLSTATDGIQALAAIHRDPPDVVILDLVLPHLDGLQVCREIRRHGILDSVAILVVTSRTESQLKIEALRAGASDYVTKPFEPEELDARVHAHLKTKVLRDEIRSMQERLVAGGKREAVIELAGAAAHEMNQPLTGILGRAALLDRKLDPEHPGRRDLEIIREQAERLGRCVARLARVSSYDTTEYVGERRILDLEQASSTRSGAPAVLVVARTDEVLESTRLAASAAGLSVATPGTSESLAAAWDRSQAVALVLELAAGQSASDLLLATANQLSSREIPAVMIDPAGGTVPSATIEHLGALVPEGAPPTVASIERELRRAHRLGRLLRRLESRERDLAAARTLDPLTGFARREHFVEVLRSEVRRARRYGLDLGVAVFDVDDFAAINARWGEEIGNRVLRDLALVIRGCTREVDVLGRLGGELFGLVLPHTGADDSATAADRMCGRVNHEAEAIVESIRRSVERTSFGLASHEVHLTISMGVASAGAPGTLDPEELLARAESALHRAKIEGKNRVVVDDGPVDQSVRP
ncbi:MAG: diguanylate cyclase [Deltaproteobacteria bacterium]|nr:diguanylate cyclase [Deltaproteobacteria bacterium]